MITTAAVDNIDHNPRATTAKESFHGSAISLLQHPSFAGEGVGRSIVIVGGSDDKTGREDNIYWAAFHASRQPPEARTICPTALFLLPGQRPYNDPALTECRGECRGASDSWPDVSSHLRAATV